MYRTVHYAVITVAILSFQFFPQIKYQQDPGNEIIKLIPPHERIEYSENTDNPSDYYRSTEIYYDTWDGAEWVEDERTVYSYNEEEGSSEEISQIWNGSDWENSYKYTYKFNNNNNLYIYQYWNGTEWLNEYRYVYDYESGYLSNYLVQLGDSLSWNNYYRFIYYRNSQTNLEDSVLYQTWNVSAWENYQLTRYIKNSNGKDSIITYYNWSAGWVNVSRYLYSYNSSSLNYSYVYELWDGSDWVPSSRYTLNYDSNSNYLGYIYETWDGALWINASKYSYTYNGDNKQTEYKRQNWDGALWENDWRYTYEYDLNGSRTEQEYQDYVMGNWESDYRELYSYDENNNRTETLREVWDGTIFINYSRIRFFYELVTSVEDEQIVNSFQLYNNYPNPFNPSTKIDFILPEKSNVTLIIYDILGNEVQTILNSELESGLKSVSFNASGLASGVYLYKIDVKSSEGKQNFSETRKMLLMK